MKNMPKDRRAAAEQIGFRIIAAKLVAPGARPNIVVIPPIHGGYIAVNAPAGSSEQTWRELLKALPWNVRVELSHSGTQGLTFRVHPVDAEAD